MNSTPHPIERKDNMKQKHVKLGQPYIMSPEQYKAFRARKEEVRIAHAEACLEYEAMKATARFLNVLSSSHIKEQLGL